MSNSLAETNAHLGMDLNSSENWEKVCLVDDLVPDSGICVLFENRQIAIFTIGKSSELYAIANYDPFSDANVLSRGIIGSLQGGLYVASPIFKQHFCLKTGNCLEDESVSIDTYPVRLEGSHVLLKRNN